MTKAAQIHLVKGLAMIASPRIRVNSVSPGVLLTVCPSLAAFYMLIHVHFHADPS